MTREEIKNKYVEAVRVSGNSDEVQGHWFVYLADLFKKFGDIDIFLEVRQRGRTAGGALDIDFLENRKTVKELFDNIQTDCADAYAIDLTKAGVASIDLDDPRYKSIKRRAAFEVVKALTGIVNPTDKTEVCVALANTWYRWVELLHNLYGLPTVKVLEILIHAESEAEQISLDAGNFETAITASERAKLEILVR